MDVSEAVVVYDIKVDICSQLNDFFYTYQRSRSFIDPFPRCLRFSIFTSKTAGLIETKLHVEPLLDGVMKHCSWDLGLMIKMVVTPIYSKIL